MAQPDPAVPAPLPPPDAAAVRDTADYLGRRGLVVVPVIQSAYLFLDMLRGYALDASPRVDLRLPVVSFLPTRWLSYRLTMTHDEMTLTPPVGGSLFRWRAALSDVPAQLEQDRLRRGLIIHLVLSYLVSVATSIVYAIPSRLFLSVLRSWSVTLRTALTSVPVLLAILVVVFATGDAWRTYGNEPATRFALLIAIIIVVSVAAMVSSVRRVPGGWRQVAWPPAGEQTAALARRTPARALAAGGQAPAQLAGLFGYVVRALRVNSYILFWFTLIAQLLSVTVLVSFAFLVIGVVAIDATATRDLLGEPADVWGQFGFLGQHFVISRPLVLLSVMFGSVAALTLAADLRQEKLAAFLDSALVYHQRCMAALACYVAVVADLQRKMFSPELLAEMDPERKRGLFGVINGLLAGSDPQTIDAVLRFLHRQGLTSWAADYGLSLLAGIPAASLRALKPDQVDFVLAAAEAAPAPEAGTIALVRARRATPGPGSLPPVPAPPAG